MTNAGPLPNFFIIGAQKCGTTTLHSWLNRHPEIYLCEPKEPDYFSKPERWTLGEEWYRSLFASAGDSPLVGEASPSYAMYPFFDGVVERLTSTIDQPRLIYLVRDPVERMRSSYQHALAGGMERKRIGDALRSVSPYLLTTGYAFQLERWLTRVPRERILLASLEEMRDQPLPFLARVQRFLGADPDWQPRPEDLRAEHVSADKRAPRRYWRALGGAIIRYDKGHLVPNWMGRLDRTGLARRSIRRRELAVPEAVADQLRRALEPDLARLRRHWGPEHRPDWLENNS